MDARRGPSTPIVRAAVQPGTDVASSTPRPPRPGEQVRVLWDDRRTTSANVLHVTPGIVLLEGSVPTGERDVAVGTLVKLHLVVDSTLLSGRLAAHGRGGRYLVSLGERAVRWSNRARVDLPGVVRCASLPQPVPVRITNLSRRGARLEGLQLPVGADFDLTFTPPGVIGAVTVRAVVARPLPAPRQAGVGVALRLGVLWFGAAPQAGS